MKKNACYVLACGALGALAVGFLAGQDRAAREPKAAAEAQDPKRTADEEALRKRSGELVRALEKGDARALAGLWTEEGEYVADNGTTVRGRAALEAAYAKLLGKAPRLKAEVAPESLRFLSRDSAVEEGLARVWRDRAAQPVSSRYSALYVREDGRWLIALLREWPDDGATLQDLDWLVGNWVAKTGDTEVRTTYAWDESKAFLRARFTVQEKDRTVSGTQTIGKDPRTGQLRSWLFQGDGGFGEASWSRNGKRWVLEATGVQPDGGEMTATNLLTPVDHDSFTWQSVNRTADGDELPEIAPLKVTRVK